MKARLVYVALLLWLAAACNGGFRTRKVTVNERATAALHNLVVQARVESAFVGAAAAPSASYASYRTLASLVGHDEILALLEHESPVVRAYFARHVAETMPADVPALLPLLSDGTTIQVMSGCMLREEAVSTMVANSVAASDSPAARVVLERALKQRAVPAATRAVILQALAKSG